MSTLIKTQIPTVIETTVTSIQRTRFKYRFAYARALDTRISGDTGQDYIVIVEDKNRLAFALCDGVSQSFFGDIAAKNLGEDLVHWMFDLDLKLSQDEISQLLHNHLESLAPAATKLVQEFKVPDNLPLMLQKALDQKRIIGSETTFISGCVDIASQSFIFAWMGDSILRIWGPDREKTSAFSHSFQKNERWSTSKGCVGQTHIFSGPIQELSHFVAYSDGLTNLNEIKMLDELNDQFVNARIEASGDDDMSYFEFWVDPQVLSEKKKVEIPVNLHARQTGSYLEILWEACTTSSFYQVELKTEHGEISYKQTKLPSIKIPLGDFPNGLKSIRVRKVQDNVPGNWSEAIYSTVSIGETGKGIIINPPRTTETSNLEKETPKGRKIGWIIIFCVLAAIICFMLGFLAGVIGTKTRTTPTVISFTQTPTPISTINTLKETPTLTDTYTPEITVTLADASPALTITQTPEGFSTLTPEQEP